MLGGQPGMGKTSRLRFDAEDELRRDRGFIARPMRAQGTPAGRLVQSSHRVGAYGPLRS